MVPGSAVMSATVLPTRTATSDDVEEVLRLAVMYAAMGVDAEVPGWREAVRAGYLNRLGQDVVVSVVDDAERPGALAACGAGVTVRRLPGPSNLAAAVGYLQWIYADALAAAGPGSRGDHRAAGGNPPAPGARGRAARHAAGRKPVPLPRLHRGRQPRSAPEAYSTLRHTQLTITSSRTPPQLRIARCRRRAEVVRKDRLARQRCVLESVDLIPYRTSVRLAPATTAALRRIHQVASRPRWEVVTSPCNCSLAQCSS